MKNKDLNRIKHFKGGSYTAYIILDVNYTNGESDEFGFKLAGNLDSMWNTYMVNNEYIVTRVIGEFYKQKIKDIKNRFKLTEEEFEVLDEYRKYILRLYNEYAVKTENFFLDIFDRHENKDIEETVDRLLNRYRDETE